MKRVMRAGPVQSFLAWILSGYLRFVYATSRWQVDGADIVKAAQEDPDNGAIVCFWHSRISLCAKAWDNRTSPKQCKALVSNSKDGDFITDVLGRLGFPSVRGSRAREGRAADKGGAQAFREILRDLKAGGAQGVTPDGPKGPALVMGEGAPMLARMSGANVLFLGMAFSPCIRAKSWDRTVFPLPFGKGAIVWRGPVTAGRDDDPAGLAEDWGAKLIAVTDMAEEMVR